MQGIGGEMLEALAAVPPAVLRALAGVPVEALQALGAGALEERLRVENRPLQEVVVEAPEGARAARQEQYAEGRVFNPAGGELEQALNRVDEILKRVDANVVMCFGKFRTPRGQQGWWNGWIDSGGGGVTRLLELPDYKVAEVFAVLGSEVRLAILRSLLDRPRSAAELVADLRLGTTGQAYHHLQELIRTGFVEARDATYYFNGGRTRAYFTALAVAADFVPKAPEEAEGGA
jgi:DNA-binding transcriptional ArsR family regulator